MSTHIEVPCCCWEIPESNGLDRIHAFWMNVGPGQGYVTIICYGQAWTAYFGGMGDRTIQQFFAMADTSYMVTKMGITPALKQSKKNDAYLGRIIDAVRKSVRAEALRPA